MFVNSCSLNIPDISYKYDVTIYRDTWGVPHIYGNTDEDLVKVRDDSERVFGKEFRSKFILDEVYLCN